MLASPRHIWLLLQPVQYLTPSHQIVRRRHQLPAQSDPLQPHVQTPTEPSNGLHPPEDRLHPLTGLLTRSVCRMTGGPSIYRRPPLLLGNMRDDIELPALRHEVPAVKPPVCSHAYPSTAEGHRQHVQRRIPLSHGVRLQQIPRDMSPSGVVAFSGAPGWHDASSGDCGVRSICVHYAAAYVALYGRSGSRASNYFT